MIVDRLGNVYFKGRRVGSLGSFGEGDEETCAWSPFPWEAWKDCKWCDRKFGPDGERPDANLLKDCRKPSPLGPPWTDIGAGARNLPKDSIITSVIATVRLPSPEEYLPHNLLRTSIVDPPRMVALAAYASVVAPQMAPVFARYAAPFPANLNVLPEAVASAYAAGGWPAIQSQLLDPVLDALGDRGKLLLDAIVPGGPGIAAAGIVYSARRNAKWLKAKPDSVSQQLGAILEAVADSAGPLVSALLDPAKFTGAGPWETLGRALQSIAPALPSGDVAAFVKTTGEALDTFSPSLAAAASGRITGEGGALDNLPLKIPGIRMSFSAMRTAFKARESELRTLLTKAKGSIQPLNIIGQGLSAITDALYQIKNWFMGADPLKVISNIIEPLIQAINEFKAFVEGILSGGTIAASSSTESITPARPAAIPIPNPIATAREIMGFPSKPSLLSLPTRSLPTQAILPPISPPPSPQAAAPKPRRGVIGPMLAGAAVGLVAGGPAGALLGAGGGAVLALIRHRKP